MAGAYRGLDPRSPPRGQIARQQGNRAKEERGDRVVGSQIKAKIWELLLAVLVMQSAFGMLA